MLASLGFPTKLKEKESVGCVYFFVANPNGLSFQSWCCFQTRISWLARRANRGDKREGVVKRGVWWLTNSMCEGRVGPQKKKRLRVWKEKKTCCRSVFGVHVDSFKEKEKNTVRTSLTC